MGNSSLEVRACYQNREKSLSENSLQDFNQLNQAIKKEFGINSSTPIVIQLDETYHSTKCGWPKKFKGNKLNLKIWNQIEQSVQDSINTLNFKRHLFKVHNQNGNILGLGLFLSQDVLLIPRKYLDDNLDISKVSIVFFDLLSIHDQREVETEFKLEESLCVKLGNHPSNQNFVLIQYQTHINNWRIKLPQNTNKIRGHVIYFNKSTQMLSSEWTRYESINVSGPFRLSYANDNWLPGAIFVSEKSELVGIYLGGLGKLFIPAKDIFDQLSKRLSLAIEEREYQVRDAILNIGGVELAMPEISTFVQNIPAFNHQSIEIFNPLRELF